MFGCEAEQRGVWVRYYQDDLSVFDQVHFCVSGVNSSITEYYPMFCSFKTLFEALMQLLTDLSHLKPAAQRTDPTFTDRLSSLQRLPGVMW